MGPPTNRGNPNCRNPGTSPLRRCATGGREQGTDGAPQNASEESRGHRPPVFSEALRGAQGDLMAERTTSVAELTWKGDLAFDARTGGHSLVVDGNAAAGPSPMQTLAISVAGCMASDVVDIIRK